MGVKFSNNAKTTLSASVSTSATSVSVASSSGFPSLSGGDYFYATMVQQSDDTALEIVKVTAVSGTTWTVSRAQDNTSATAFASGDKIELRASAGVFIDLFAEKAPIANPTFTGNLTIGSAEISETELEILDGATVTTAELNKLDGTTATAASLTYGKDLYDTGVTAAEFDYLDGVTSNIQTQISTKLTTPSGFARGSVIIGDSSGNPANLSAGANGYVLKSDGTDVTWAEDEKTTTTNFVKNAFTGDNTTTAFTLSQSPNSEDNLIVFIEGVFQNQGDYALSGTTLTFDEAPATGRKIVAYHVKAAVSGANLNHDQFTASGSAAFTLSITPINENNTQVFIDGVYQQKTDYSVSGTTLTFDTAPASGAIVEVMTFTQTEINVPTTGSVVTASIANDVNLNGNPTTTTQSAGNNTTRIATTAFVETAVSNLIDSAPGTMNTLNEIAAALGDDPSFTTTVNNAIATKLPLAGGTMTGNLVVGGSGFTTTTINSTRTSGNIGGINFSASGTNKAQIYGTVDGQLKLGTGGDGTVDSSLALTLNAAGNATFAGTISSGAITSSGTITASGSTTAGVLTLESTAASDLTITTTGANTWEFSNAGNNSVYNGYSHTFKNGSSSTGLTIDSLGRATFPNAATFNSTISSGAITSSGNLHAGDGTNISMDSSANGQLEVDGDAYQGAIALDGTAMHIYHNSPIRSLILGTNETARLTIDGTGNVGIGQAPNMKLNILHADQDGLRFNTANDAETFIDFGDTDDNDIGRISYDHADNSMSFRTNNSNDRLVIDSSGKVGIGTASPNTKLQVNDGTNLNINVGTLGGVASVYSLNDAGSAYTAMRIDAAGAGLALNSYSGGNVGIGTASPTKPLSVYAGDANGNIVLTRAGTSENLTLGTYYITATSNDLQLASSAGKMTFSAGGSEKMRIEANGKVGINNTDPTGYYSDNLVVGSDDEGGITIASSHGSHKSYLMFADGTSGSAAYRGSVGYDHNLDQLSLGTGGGTNRLNIDNSGKVGIGTGSPTEYFTVDGLITGGFGASTTSGTLDFNHLTNARAGMGHTLLLGTATNGFNVSAYFHVLNFEYAAKLGTGNMTQLAIGYNYNGVYIRYRYGGNWASWAALH